VILLDRSDLQHIGAEPVSIIHILNRKGVMNALALSFQAGHGAMLTAGLAQTVC
jgi:hypothetical protein